MARNRTPGVLVESDPAKILNAIRNSASLDYQRRIPTATKGSVADTLKTLHKYGPAWNEFVDALVNRIGSVVARDISWSNPLAEFKQGMLEYGDTIEEVQTGLVESKVYNPARDYLEGEIFGRHDIDVQSSFHTVNRQEYYAVTVDEVMLRRAFLEQGGVSSFISQIMAAPTTSDNWDEFLLTMSLFREYEANGGFWKVKIPDLSTYAATEQDSKAVLKRLRALGDILTFPSTQYNAANMPVFAKKEDLVVFASPEFIANIDVDALAAAFNIDRAIMPQRMIAVPKEHFGIDGAQAVLTTKDFFMIADTSLENTSQYNPVSRRTNYFLHHHEVISASRFVPAILFNTTTDSEVINVVPTGIQITDFAVKDKAGAVVSTVEPGTDYNVISAVSGTGVDNLEISRTYTITGNASSRTTVNDDGLLHVDREETATSITVVVTLEHKPKSGRGETVTKTKQVSVRAANAAKPNWPKA